MFTNAKVTITRRGTSYDSDRGHRKAGQGSTVLSDVRCVFSQNKSTKRSVNYSGMKEFVKPAYSLLIEGQDSVVIQPGDQATVTPDKGPAQEFTVEDAVHTVGVMETHWECDISMVKHPA